MGCGPKLNPRLVHAVHAALKCVSYGAPACIPTIRSDRASLFLGMLSTEPMTEPQQKHGERPTRVILAGASVRSLAESAIRCGIQPHCLDMFGDADLRQSLHRHSVLQPVQTIGCLSALPDALADISGEIPLVWCGGLENHPDVLRRLVRQRQVCGASVEAIQRIRTPQLLSEIVAPSGCRVPDSRLSSNAVPPPLPSADWLCKPLRGSGGTGIVSCDRQGSARTSPSYFQRRVCGIPVSATFVASRQDCQFAGAAGQLTGITALGGREFWFGGNAGPLRLTPELQQTICSAGRCIANSGLVGVFGVDLVLSDDRVWLLEVNPRITASHELLDFANRDQPLLVQQLEIFGQRPPACRRCQKMRGDEDPGTNREEGLFARFVVYSKRRGTLTTHDVARLLKWTRDATRVDADFPTCWVADVPNPGPISPGVPFCSVYHLLSETHSDAARRAIDATVGQLAGLFHLNTIEIADRCRRLLEFTTAGDNANCSLW